jgi:hypothetical protein
MQGAPGTKNKLLNKTIVISLAAVLFYCPSCRWQASAETTLESRAKGALSEDMPRETAFTKVDSVVYVSMMQQMQADTAGQDTTRLHFPVPVCDAILPYYRVVAMYGNFYTPNMGILGALPEQKLLQLLLKEQEAWEKADTLTPVMPAIHYIAVTAQKKPGSSGKYRLRMPESQILKAIQLARKAEGITFLDIQVGHSSVKEELPPLSAHLRLPDVHLALDPEWSMLDGSVPGTKIGSMHADDINFAVDYLAGIVKKHKLPPKILVVHRFTEGMIQQAHTIRRSPYVQIVINMDGFGFPAKKKDSYRRVVGRKPVQFTGFKLFYKNDALSPPHRLMSPDEILKLKPRPMYIQYQ